MRKFASILFLIALATSCRAQIPANAEKLLPLVKSEQARIIPTLVLPEYVPALIEHESCVSLKSPRCFSPSAKLLSKREEGGGLGQLTRAFNNDGSIRFDSLTDIRRRHPRELGDLSWSNLYTRPDLQIRALLLMSRDNLNQTSKMTPDPLMALKFADAAYNGGLGGLKKERAACALSSNCNPEVWDNNVERFCMKSKAPLYAGRSACDINRHHVHDVFLRAKKYGKHPIYNRRNPSPAN